MENYIRFDWAMKRLLRNKANYAVLESESNQEDEFDKYNRVDIHLQKSRIINIEQIIPYLCTDIIHQKINNSNHD